MKKNEKIKKAQEKKLEEIKELNSITCKNKK